MLTSTLMKKWLFGLGAFAVLCGGSLYAGQDADTDAYVEKGLKVVDRGEGRMLLQMPHAFYTGPDGRQVELLGAVHLADKKYYDHLNELFYDYDKVFFEMVGGEDIPRCAALMQKVENGEGLSLPEIKELQDIMNRQQESARKYFLMGLLEPYYDALAGMLGLATQSEAIDYMSAGIFVHADMSLKELKSAMEKKGESFVKFMLMDFMSDDEEKPAYEPDPVLFVAALLRKDTRFLRSELIKVMASEEEKESMTDSVILTGRNEKCFEVFDAVMKEPGNNRVAIFYGASHLPGMHKMLLDRRFKLDKVEWMTAWDTDAKP